MRSVSPDVPDRPRVLQLVRHAKSSWADPSLADMDRPLSGRGQRAGEALALHLASIDQRPDIVLSSPAKRALQTLAAIEGALGGGVEIRIEPAVYEADIDDLLAVLREVTPTARAVLVIGHYPSLADLAVYLSVPDDSQALARMRAKFPTAALATLLVPGDWDALAASCARVHSFWTPR